MAQTYRADNLDGRVPARDYDSLESVPTGTGYNRVTLIETGEFWVRGAFPGYGSQWSHYPAPK